MNYRRLMIGTAAVYMALTFAWACAVLSWAQRQVPIQPAPSAVRLNPSADRVTPFAVLRTPSADRGTPNAVKPYVASIRADSNTFHLRDCSKFGKSLKVVKEYSSQEEAAADGKQPCSFCLPQGIARVK